MAELKTKQTEAEAFQSARNSCRNSASTERAMSASTSRGFPTSTSWSSKSSSERHWPRCENDIRREGDAVMPRLMRRTVGVTAALLIAMAFLSCADAPRRVAPPGAEVTTASTEIRVLSAVGMRRAMLELGPEYEAATGHKLRMSFDSGAVLVKRLEAGETADVVMIPRSALDRLRESGRVIGSSVTDLATSSVGVAVRAGARKPDISTVAAFRQAMLNARSIACPDPALGGSSGLHIARIFSQLGIAEAVRPKLVLASTPSEAGTLPGDLLAAGQAEMALHQMQELMATPAIEVVGPLPDELQETFVFSAAILTHCRDVPAAKALLDFLRTSEANAVLERIGMTPVARRR